MPRWLTAQVNGEHNKAFFGGLNILQEGYLWKVIQFNAINRPSGIMRFFSANYALFFGELCAQNPELCANYANCAIFLSEKF